MMNIRFYYNELGRFSVELPDDNFALTRYLEDDIWPEVCHEALEGITAVRRGVEAELWMTGNSSEVIIRVEGVSIENIWSTPPSRIEMSLDEYEDILKQYLDYYDKYARYRSSPSEP